ncbi:MAG: hypothetical protein KIT33_15945 [Candidatus Kapabacteria bacterium]|nr:hypothetical protein [Ignavibacteriota bacterium]MCW5886464.1 hypothetical protein [Candidatus Kapabacteria bacterium]
MNNSRCRSCGQAIKFLKTHKGHLMPVDSESVGDNDVSFDKDIHKSHFATCPNANKHRKSHKSKLSVSIGA